jgi:hypothetical protein
VRERFTPVEASQVVPVLSGNQQLRTSYPPMKIFSCEIKSLLRMFLESVFKNLFILLFIEVALAAVVIPEGAFVKN